jgi:hypothetical protein
MASAPQAIPFLIRVRTISTASAVPYLAARLDLDVMYGSRTPFCFFDTGAPFSVVTADVAQVSPWVHAPGPYLDASGQAIALDWEGTPCVFGEAKLALFHPANHQIYRMCRLVGKFVQRPHPKVNNQILLGLNFLTDNAATLNLTGSPALAGELRFP